MAETASTMKELGSKAPDFHLPDVTSGQIISPAVFASKKGLLVMFICKHCPYVKYVQQELARIGKDYAEKSLGIIAISSNDASKHPDDAPERLKAMSEELGFIFPFCYDESQETARAYGAACTPDFFLYDQDRTLVYRGQLDNSRPGNNLPVDGSDLRAAIDAVLEDKPISSNQKPSIGCNIKWKAGNEPSY